MNVYEWVLWVCALLIVGGYVHWRYRSWRVTAALVALASVPLYISLYKMTQFMTIDEPYFMLEIRYIRRHDELRFWYEYGVKLRTSYWLYGVPVRVIQFLYHAWGEYQGYRLLKVTSWLFSLGTLLVSHYVVEKYLLRKERNEAFFAVFLAAYILLPVVDMVFRAFTYDTISLQFAVLAVLLIIVALQKTDTRFALIAVIVAFLAAQEKPTAAPILFAIMSVYAYIYALSQQPDALTTRPGIRHFVNLAKGLVYGLGATLIISLADAVVVTLIRGLRDGLSLVVSFLDPYTAWAISIGEFTLNLNITPAYNIGVLAFTLVAFYGGAVVLLFAGYFLAQVKQTTLQRLIVWFHTLNTGLVIVSVVVGLLGIFAVTGYLGGIIPPEAGQYVPVTESELQGGVRHFGTYSALAHTASFVAYNYGLYLADIPTAVWILFGAGMVIPLILRRQSASDDINPFVDLALLGGLLMPLAFGLANLPYPVPHSARYMSSGLLLFIVLLLVVIWNSVSTWRSVWQWVLSTGFTLLVVVEMFPFMPMPGAFQPIWLNLPVEDEHDIRAGIASPAWGGWGEELALAGEQIYGQCGQTLAGAGQPAWTIQNCDEIRLYSTFPGVWMRGGEDALNTGLAVEQRSYIRETDYWLINRSAVILRWATIPKIEPELTLYYRGYPYAWVYQGSKLAESGYYGPVE